LDEAVTAFRLALEEKTRERVPPQWAMTQMNLGVALAALRERESGTVRLGEAVAAFREALKEWTRERVPLDWAMTQMSLGNALWRLGERESGTARLEEAVAAYRARTTLFEPPLSPTCARATAAFENARRPVQQLLLPVVDPVRMNAELTRQLGDRPVPPRPSNDGQSTCSGPGPPA
jgi:hypothetical protein